MPCDTQRLPAQTLTQRKEEVRKALLSLDRGLLTRRIRPIIDRATGAIAFQGWAEQDRGRISDACAYRLLMVTGSSIAKSEIARAEAMSGRSVNRAALAAGHHSHDGGHTWHHGH